MFCGQCGTSNPDTNQFCKNCGKPLRKSQQAAPPVPAPAAAVSPQPATAPSYYIPPAGAPQQAPGVQPVYQAPPAAQPATLRQPWSKGKKFALVSIVFGIGAFIYVPYIFGILGVILGALSIREKYKPGAVGILISIAAMLINYLYIFLF